MYMAFRINIQHNLQAQFMLERTNYEVKSNKLVRLGKIIYALLKNNTVSVLVVSCGISLKIYVRDSKTEIF